MAKSFDTDRQVGSRNRFDDDADRQMCMLHGDLPLSSYEDRRDAALVQPRRGLRASTSIRQINADERAIGRDRVALLA